MPWWPNRMPSNSSKFELATKIRDHSVMAPSAGPVGVAEWAGNSRKVKPFDLGVLWTDFDEFVCFVNL